MRGERGSVTAEFATVLPAVMLVLACCLACLQVAGQQLRLQDAAAGAARSLARGDPATSSGLAGVSIGSSHRGELVCANLSLRSTAALGTILGLTLTASSCALAGGK
jgi:hypothetical protein